MNNVYLVFNYYLLNYNCVENETTRFYDYEHCVFFLSFIDSRVSYKLLLQIIKLVAWEKKKLRNNINYNHVSWEFLRFIRYNFFWRESEFNWSIFNADIKHLVKGKKRISKVMIFLWFFVKIYMRVYIICYLTNNRFDKEKNVKY